MSARFLVYSRDQDIECETLSGAVECALNLDMAGEDDVGICEFLYDWRRMLTPSERSSSASVPAQEPQ